MVENNKDTLEILKELDIFGEAPEDILRHLIPLLAEVEFKAGTNIFQKGDIGDCMYIIKKGMVRVHDGVATLNNLGEYEVFGEMAALSSEERSASVTALEDTRLLRLDQQTFFELIKTRPAVAEGIINVLVKALRARAKDLSDLRTQMEQIILPLGASLSLEEDLGVLLEEFVTEAMSMTKADAGKFYLREGNVLNLVVVRVNSLGLAYGGGNKIPASYPPIFLVDPETQIENHTNVVAHIVLHKHTINVANVVQTVDFDFDFIKKFDEAINYKSVSCLLIPVVNHTKQAIGVIELTNATDPATQKIIPFDPYKQLLTESLTSQAAMALTNRSLMDHEHDMSKLEMDLQIGRKIQRDFLPRDDQLPQPEGWEIASRFQPAREVAGDFFDAFPLPHNRIGVVIADVVDKGVGAALFMALSRSLLRAYAQQHRPLSWLDNLSGDELLHTDTDLSAQRRRILLSTGAGALLAVPLTNDYIANNHGDMTMFATTFFGVLDPVKGTLTYINGGHEEPIIVGPDGKIKSILSPTGPAMGMMASMDFDIKTVKLKPGDLLMTYTDGVPDARSPKRERFGKERLRAILESQPITSAVDVLDRVMKPVTDFIADADQFDDITMLAVWYKPDAQPVTSDEAPAKKSILSQLDL